MAALLLGHAGCGADGSVAGTYAFDCSLVVTARPDADTCGLPAFPSNQYDATFVVAEPHDHKTTVTEQANECAFLADVQGGRVTATNVECIISPNAAARLQWGLFRRRYADFSLDAKRQTWAASTESWQELKEGTVHTCATANGRLRSFRMAE
jgi:hypothetical protein